MNLKLRSLLSIRGESVRSAGFVFMFVFLVVWVFSSRIFKLDTIPAGLFFDESSIGYNAATILRSGADEYGIRFPVYFKSVGDYKNPVYIYAVAAVFSLLGISEFTLRLTSVIIFGIALFFWMLLLARVFGGNKAVAIFGLAAFGFSPLFFVISRISFEVISQLAVLSAFTLSVWTTFNERSGSGVWMRDAAICGFLLGLSTYTYTTQRFLSGLILIVLWVVFYNRGNLQKLLLISTIFFLALVPFFFFIHDNPGVITERFNDLSYVDDPIGASAKVWLFLRNYSVYWLPDYLILHGDPNLRHSTGYGGVIFTTVLILFFFSLPLALARMKVTRFKAFLVASLLITPIPAALITEGSPHALRSMMMGYYFLFLSCYSLEWLASVKRHHVLKTAVFFFLFAGVLYEAAAYQVDYFFHYPSRSVEDFGSFDFRSAVEFALEHDPEKIVAAGLPPGGVANVQFYSLVVENPRGVPIELREFTEPAPGVCVLFHRRTDVEGGLEGYSLPYEKFFSRKKLDAIEELFHADKFGGVIRVRCY